jgi:hypothetical protein
MIHSISPRKRVMNSAAGCLRRSTDDRRVIVTHRRCSLIPGYSAVMTAWLSLTSEPMDRPTLPGLTIDFPFARRLKGRWVSRHRSTLRHSLRSVQVRSRSWRPDSAVIGTRRRRRSNSVCHRAAPRKFQEVEITIEPTCHRDRALRPGKVASICSVGSNSRLVLTSSGEG